MLLFTRPTTSQIQQFLEKARESEHTYSEIGATAGLPPPLYRTDHNRVRLGAGPETWRRAVDALRRWEMFNLSWVRLCWPTTPVIAGENVAVIAQYASCYWMNACRIVYVVDEDGAIKRFGFAYGTLADHAESGEERFLVEWNQETNEVSYDLLAFSRPNQFLSRIGYPFARRLQKRFANDSKLAMVRACSQ